MAVSDRIMRWRYRYVPDHLLGEILTKRWIDNAIPLLILLVVAVVFGSLIPDFFWSASISSLMRQWGEFALIVLALMIVMVAGGIDLSVGSTFALGNIVASGTAQRGGMAGRPRSSWRRSPAAPAVGLVNGLLVGYLRLRAFLTTLVTLIIVSAMVDMLLLKYSVAIAAGVCRFRRRGTSSARVMSWECRSALSLRSLSPLAAHLVLTRSRVGWHVLATGGSRRSAHNVGIPVRRVICVDLRGIRNA